MGNSNANNPSILEESFLEKALNLTLDVVIIYQTCRDENKAVIDFTIEAVNDAGLLFFGSSRPEIIGKRVSSIWPDIQQNPFWIWGLEVIETQKLKRSEIQRLTPSGELKWFDVTLQPYNDGFANYSRDITAYKKDLENSELQKKLYEELITHSLNRKAVFMPIVDEHGNLENLRFDYANFGKNIDDSARGLQYYDLELPGKFISDILPSIKRSKFWNFYENIFKTGLAAQSNLDYTFDGIAKMVSIFGKMLEDGRMLVVYSNISESHQLAIALEVERKKYKESSDLFNTVLEASPNAISVFKSLRDDLGQLQDFKPIIVNEQSLKIAKLERDQYFQKNLFERDPNLKPSALALLNNVISNRVTNVSEIHVPNSESWVHVITTPLDDGFVSTVQDITTQKKQIAIIEEQVLLFNGVLNSLQNGLTIFQIVKDENGEFLDLIYLEVSASVIRDTGMSRDELVGQTIRSKFPGIEATSYWTGYAALVRTGQPQMFETHYAVNGYNNFMINWVSPLGSDKLVSTYHIINDLKKVQSELEFTIEELRKSNEDLEQFASIASHDLQEPLRKVQSFGNMLEHRYSETLNEDGKDLLRRMQNAAGRMRNLVTGLLDFASLSRGREDQLLVVDLNILLKELVNDQDDLLKETNGAIILNAGIPKVMGLESQLRQLFHNLFANAIKFRRPDVNLEIKVHASPLLNQDMKYLALNADRNQFVKIIVVDNGIGFNQSYAERIFGLFERLHGQSEYKGTGIGLSICRRVVERHGGAIWAESLVGRGASFSIVLQKATDS